METFICAQQMRNFQVSIVALRQSKHTHTHTHTHTQHTAIAMHKKYTETQANKAYSLATRYRKNNQGTNPRSVQKNLFGDGGACF